MHAHVHPIPQVEARKYIEKPRRLHKTTIIERYANFGSTTYAPVQREGRFPEAKPKVRGCGCACVYVCVRVRMHVCECVFPPAEPAEGRACI